MIDFEKVNTDVINAIDSVIYDYSLHYEQDFHMTNETEKAIDNLSENLFSLLYEQLKGGAAK